jgi:hypothetical protein
MQTEGDALVVSHVEKRPKPGSSAQGSSAVPPS